MESLTWREHINLATGWIQLPGTGTKKSRRKVPIASRLHEALLTASRNGEFVVEPWANVRRDLAAACRRAGIPRVSPNDLRRTFASWLKQAGVDSMVVARLMGHTTSRMVELVYGQLNDATYTRAIANLPDAPQPSPLPPGASSLPPSTAPAIAPTEASSPP